MPASLARAAARVGALAATVTLLLLAAAGAPAVARAQTATGAKALVYCPVGVDTAGCDQIVKTLTGTAAFPGGVDRAYDATSGTVDLAYVTLSQYAVLVIPSLADDSTHSPYAVLRSATVQAHLKAGVTGRVAVWGGTPDLGSDATTRPAKDQLIVNLASWGATDWSVAGTTGLVVLADLSADAARRYDWLAGVSRLTVTADPELYGFDAATPLTGTAKTILKSGSTTTPYLAYTNMASFGLDLPAGASVGTVDATGTADSSGTTVTRTLLVTTPGGGNTGAATIKTDKADYAPGETVTFTGSGWTAGETVTITLHENPTIHPDDVLSATASASGAITNNQYAPEAHDVGVTYYVTAKGGTSGLIAQTSFTDATNASDGDGAMTVSPTSTASGSTGGTYVFTFAADPGKDFNLGSQVTLAIPSGWTGPTLTGGSSTPGKTTVSTTGLSPACSALGTATVSGNTITVPMTCAAKQQFSITYANVTAPSTAGAYTFTTKTKQNGGTLTAIVTSPVVTVTAPTTVATTTTVTSGTNPSTYGSSVTFTAKVAAATGTAAPTGTVQFKVDGVNQGAAATLAQIGTTDSSAATLSISTLTAGTHSITAVYAPTGVFTASDNTAAPLSQTVNKATPTITWANPADITYGTALSATQLNATASVPGAFVYSPAAGAVLNAGAGQTLSTTFTPTDATNYTTATKSVAINVLQASQTISFTAPTGVKYGDADFALGATASSGLTVAYASSTTGVCTIVSGNLLHVVAAGSCSVTASQAGNTNYAAATPVTQSFTIAAKPVVITPTSGQSKTYGTTDPTLTFSNDASLAASAFTGALGRAPGENVGTYAINLGTLSAGTNYALSLSATPVTFAITRATPTFSGLSAPAITYGAPSATISGTLKAGSIPATGSVSVTVAGSGGSLSASSAIDASGNFSATVNPSGLAASATGYAISLSYAQTANFEAASDNSLTLVVNKAGQIITFNALGAKTFGDADFTVSASASSGLTVSFAVGASDQCTIAGSTVHLTGAGSCTVTASQSGDGNYIAATSVAQTFSIGKATPTVSAVGGTFTYDNTAKTGSGSATGVGGASLTVSLSYYNGNPAAGPALASAPVNAGSYTVRASFAGDANYNAAAADAALTIGKATSSVAVTCPTTPVTYTGAAQTPCSATATGAGGLSVAVTPSYSNNVDAGTASVSATFAGDANHDGSSGTGSFTIAKATPTVNVSWTGGTFGASNAATGSVVGVGGADLGVPTFSYEGTGTTTYGPSATAPTNAGSYKVTASYAGSANYNTASATTTTTIAKAVSSVAVTCPTTPLTYTGAAQTPCTAVATGVGGLSQSLTPSYTDNVNVGTASVSATFAGDANHLGSSGTGSFAIAKANPVVVAVGGSFTYSGAPHAGSGTATGVLSEDLGAVSLQYSGTGTTSYGPSATAPTNAGSYAVTASYAGSANYNAGTSAPAALTIAKATPTVTIDPTTLGSFTYTAAAHVATGTVTGVGSPAEVLGAATVAYDNAGTPLGAAPKDVGTYGVTASFAGNGNYNPAQATGSFTITPATPTVVWSNPAAITYGTPLGATQLNAQAQGVGGDGTIAGTFTYSPAAGAHLSAGAGQTLTVAFAPTSANYVAVPSTSVTIDVNKAPLTVTADDQQRVYGDANPTLTAQISGYVYGENATTAHVTGAPAVTTTATATSPVSGSPYAITPSKGTLAAPNYTFDAPPASYVNGKLVVKQAPLTVTVNNKSKIQGDALPTLDGTIAGIKNGDAISATYATTATVMSPPGSYPITATLVDPTAKLPNYAVTNTPGTLTVTPNQPPVITQLTLPTAPVQLGTAVPLSMTFTDADVSASTPYALSIDWGDGKTPTSWTETAPGTISKSYQYATPGVYSVTVSVADKVNTVPVTQTFQYVVVYDPNGGFVTGGGWINSPAGAYVANPALSGKATFGFVSKYQNGATTPTGNTEFQFQEGSFTFKSTSYDWLTISGARAQYKGSGSINGSGDYGFMLTATDGDVSGGGGTDKFRMKVWNKTTGAIIYDNQMGSSDTADPTTTLGGGSIVIHK